MGLFGKLKNKKLQLQQKGNQRLVKKQKKLKNKLEKRRVYETNKAKVKTLKQDYAKLTGKTSRMQRGKERRKKFVGLAKKISSNNKSRTNNQDNTPYWLKSSNNSNNNMYGNSSDNTPYWLKPQGEKKEKKERGKTITIRL